MDVHYPSDPEVPISQVPKCPKNTQAKPQAVPRFPSSQAPKIDEGPARPRCASDGPGGCTYILEYGCGRVVVVTAGEGYIRYACRTDAYSRERVGQGWDGRTLRLALDSSLSSRVAISEEVRGEGGGTVAKQVG